MRRSDELNRVDSAAHNDLVNNVRIGSYNTFKKEILVVLGNTINDNCSGQIVISSFSIFLQLKKTFAIVVFIRYTSVRQVFHHCCFIGNL